MKRANARLAVLLAALLAAPVARAQFGIDLGGTPKQKTSRKDKGKKKKGDARKPEHKAPPPAEEPLPAPAPAPEPEAKPPPVTTAPGEPPERPPAPKPEKVQGLTLKPADPRAAAAAKEQLDAAKKLLAERATQSAALAFDEIVRDKLLAPAHDEARYLRAKAIARLGLGHSALAAFDDILEIGPSKTRYFQSAMEWIFFVGRGLKNEQPLVSRVVRYAGQGMPPAYEGRINYLLAKYEFERGRALSDAGRTQDARGAYSEARRLVSKVHLDTGAAALGVAGGAAKEGEPGGGDAGDAFARAKFVDGLVQFAMRDDQGASDAFKDVVRLTNPKRNPRADQSLREAAFLQLARIHYQNRQNRYAIFYYDKMPWGGERWLEGLWEAAYAHYRIGNYEKALGNLLTLQSPYFKDEYFPESYILKAIVYYENCRYPEARQVLDTFASLYDPVYKDLVRITGEKRSADATYELMREAGRREGGMTRKILKLANTDQDVHRLSESIAEIESESDIGIGGRRPEFVESSLAKELKEKLAAERASLVEEVAARARAKLEYERDQLRQLLASALRIQIEVSRKEREALEGSIAKGRQVDVVKDLKYSHAVSDEHLYWPYEGEFWRDELGTYSYTLTRGCKDRLPRPGATAGR